LAAPLLDSLPSYFRTHTDSVFGCPDCYDQGTIHLQLVEKGLTRHWRIDPNYSVLPTEIRGYTKRVKEVLSALKK
jgi:hypothetical protein